MPAEHGNAVGLAAAATRFVEPARLCSFTSLRAKHQSHYCELIRPPSSEDIDFMAKVGSAAVAGAPRGERRWGGEGGQFAVQD